MGRFPGDFLDRIRSLRGWWRVAGGSALPGAAAGLAGDGLEFREHVEYRPGDELRHVDWNATARQGRPFTKKFTREEARSLACLVDTSASMAFGPPAKLDAALQSAAALALVGVLGGARASLHLLGGGSERIDVHRWSEAGEILARLEAVEPRGRAQQLARDLATLGDASAGGACRNVWVFSDFYDWELWVERLERLLERGVHPTLWQVLAPAELRPQIAGARQLIDAESGERRSLVLDGEALRRYGEELGRWLERIASFAARHRLARRLQRSDEEAIALLRRHLAEAGQR